MQLRLHPDYTALTNAYEKINNGATQAEKDTGNAEFQKILRRCDPIEGLRVEDMLIHGSGKKGEAIRIFRMAGLPEGAPIVVDIHGGGWRATLDIDNFRNRYIASHLECVLVSIEYGERSLEDCLASLMWIHEHAAELGGDRDRIGLHGTSYGGKLAAGLTLYLRDNGGPKIAMTVLNCPVLDIRPSVSRIQFADGPTIKGSTMSATMKELMGDINVSSPSYYQLPNFCPDLVGLPPMVVIAAEYDPLRDEAIEFAFRLLKSGVPTELYSLPRVVHGYAVLGAPLTEWMHDGVCASFRREFGIRK